MCCPPVEPARLGKHRGPPTAGVERVLLGWREYCWGGESTAGVERVLLGWREYSLGGESTAGVERVLTGVERVLLGWREYREFVYLLLGNL